METRVATPLSRPVPLSRMLVGGDLLGRNQWGSQVESQNAARGARRQPMGVEDALGHRKVSGAGARAPLTAAASGSRAGGAGAGGRGLRDGRRGRVLLPGSLAALFCPVGKPPCRPPWRSSALRLWYVAFARSGITALSGDVQPRRRSPWCRAQDAALGSLSWGGVAWTCSAVR